MRTEAEVKVAELLVTAKESLRLSVAFLSRLDGTTQHLEVVESSVPFLFREKATQRQATSLCQALMCSDANASFKLGGLTTKARNRTTASAIIESRSLIAEATATSKPGSATGGTTRRASNCKMTLRSR